MAAVLHAHQQIGHESGKHDHPGRQCRAVECAHRGGLGGMPVRCRQFRGRSAGRANRRPGFRRAGAIRANEDVHDRDSVFEGRAEPGHLAVAARAGRRVELLERSLKSVHHGLVVDAGCAREFKAGFAAGPSPLWSSPLSADTFRCSGKRAAGRNASTAPRTRSGTGMARIGTADSSCPRGYRGRAWPWRCARRCCRPVVAVRAVVAGRALRYQEAYSCRRPSWCGAASSGCGGTRAKGADS